MRLHDQFHRAATSSGFADDEIRAFAAHLRFAIHLSRNPQGDPVGQRGGTPRHAVDTRLPFVASFDCAALPEVDDLPLPADGTLLFFLDHEEAIEADSEEEAQSYARVVHVPAGAAVDESADRGDALFATVQAELPEWIALNEPELSDYQRHRAEAVPNRLRLCALVEKLWPKTGYSDLRLGGYSGHIGGLHGKNVYGTPETEMALDDLQSRFPDLRRHQLLADLEQELQQVRREWVPLFQFRADMVHFGRFFARRDDLAAGRFENVRCFTEFTE
ncbi:hypothetical protein BBK82_40290 [Lentzea guizhouensis]|uniref:DUF1963 domain-containing protein n=1 Tax=Lentzea guizhouensis TaxID=1586287 RepID=A0A1B2HUB3_9PSEU|nr:DUF1963 domain-containing protein [Lentzea guizhouensis]ANZ41288.1 hypothetical protein BBK82_40290 [Lentzea guizhouensis]